MENENNDKKKDFIDPATITLTSTMIFVGQQIVGGIISFVTFKFLSKYWKKDEKE